MLQWLPILTQFKSLRDWAPDYFINFTSNHIATHWCASALVLLSLIHCQPVVNSVPLHWLFLLLKILSPWIFLCLWVFFIIHIWAQMSLLQKDHFNSEQTSSLSHNSALCFHSTFHNLKLRCLSLFSLAFCLLLPIQNVCFMRSTFSLYWSML